MIIRVADESQQGQPEKIGLNRKDGLDHRIESLHVQMLIERIKEIDEKVKIVLEGEISEEAKEIIIRELKEERKRLEEEIRRLMH